MQNTLISQNYNNQPPEFTPYTESLTPNPERDNEIKGKRHKNIFHRKHPYQNSSLPNNNANFIILEVDIGCIYRHLSNNGFFLHQVKGYQIWFSFLNAQPMSHSITINFIVRCDAYLFGGIVIFNFLHDLLFRHMHNQCTKFKKIAIT
jgi:hypothetical protein